jgi:CheY-like chemotaxis protein
MQCGPRQPAVEMKAFTSLLLADEDDRTRSLLATCASETFRAVVVLEARNGSEALQLGLQQHPQIALLDTDMSPLGGIEVARTLRDLRPRTRLALRATDVDAHRERARAHRLPLFDKRDLEGALRWVEAAARAGVGAPEPESLECSSCGYGICCSPPPGRCPMCHATYGWIRPRLIA